MITTSTSASTPPTDPTSTSDRALTRREAALVKPLPERVPWSQLGPDFFEAWGYPHREWMPEHLEILGGTGTGKSFFEKTILMERARLRGSHVVIVATKPADRTLQSMGWPIVTSWPPTRKWRDRRPTDQVIFWAKAGGLSKEGRAQQKQKVQGLLSELWVPDSNLIVAFDEIAYIEQELGLRVTVETYYREARALGITIVASTQRPQGVTRYMHSESTWSVFFAPKDEDDAERMAQVAGNKAYYLRVLSELDRSKYEFLLVHNLTGEACISSIDKTTLGAGRKLSREHSRTVDRSV